MDITQILSVEATSEESMLLKVNFENRKRDAMIYLTKSMETIEVKPKDNNDNDNNIETRQWYQATKMIGLNKMWDIFDNIQATTEEMDKNWDVNIEYGMFSKDKRLQQNNWRSGRRSRNEKDDLIQTTAKVLREEDRNAILKQDFDSFMSQPKEQQTFIEFKLKLVTKIEQPSDHIVQCKFTCFDSVLFYSILFYSIRFGLV